MIAKAAAQSTCARLSVDQYPLAKKFYKQNGYSSKTNRRDLVFVSYAAHSQRHIQACLRIAPLGDCWLMRAVVVEPKARGLGVARTLIDYSVRHGAVNRVWTFPLINLTTLYEKVGFAKRKSALAPLEIQHAFAQYLEQGRRIDLMVWDAPV